jgi:hypothetical protein
VAAPSRVGGTATGAASSSGSSPPPAAAAKPRATPSGSEAAPRPQPSPQSAACVVCSAAGPHAIRSASSGSAARGSAAARPPSRRAVCSRRNIVRVQSSQLRPLGAGSPASAPSAAPDAHNRARRRATGEAALMTSLALGSAHRLHFAATAARTPEAARVRSHHNPRIVITPSSQSRSTHAWWSSSISATVPSG